MKQKITTQTLLILLAVLSLSLNSCKKEDTADPQPVNPNELITTVKVYFTNASTGSLADSVTFRDIDGPGGNAPVQDSLFLDANSQYNAQVVVLDESKTPADTISNEIREEDDIHLFVYEPSVSTGFLSTTILDTDDNGDGLGLELRVETFSPATGSWKITLRHYDSIQDKDDDTNRFDSDVEVSFGVRVN